MNSEVINVYVRGTPVAQPRQRFRATRVNGKWIAMAYHDAEVMREVDAWKKRICTKVSQGPRFEKIEGPVRMDIDLYFPRPERLLKKNSPRGAIRHITKPDGFDNCAKAIADALTSIGVWNDDCQVCEGEIKKFYVAQGDVPGARIIITRLQDPEPLLLEMPAEEPKPKADPVHPATLRVAPGDEVTIVETPMCGAVVEVMKAGVDAFHAGVKLRFTPSSPGTSPKRHAGPVPRCVETRNEALIGGCQAAYAWFGESAKGARLPEELAEIEGARAALQAFAQKVNGHICANFEERFPAAPRGAEFCVVCGRAKG